MVAIGLLRWVLSLRRTSIQQLFKSRNIDISTGTISDLSLDFLVFFGILHKQRYDKMVDLFKNNGGSILHIDGTDENGNRIVFPLKEGITEITVMSETISSESEKNITPLLSKYKSVFGCPLAVVRDMGTAVEKSTNSVFRGIPQQICHVHFLRNLGKKVMKESYESFKKKIIGFKRFAKTVQSFLL